MIKIAICDDCESDVKLISKSVKIIFDKMNISYNIKTFIDAEALLRENKKFPFDVIFLDIDMPQINGMEAATKINEQNCISEIVFVTNHDELVYKAFRFKALGFVRKKHIEEEIEEIIEVFVEHLNQKRNFLFIRDSGVEKRISINDVIYMQSDDHYVNIYTQNSRELVRKSLSDIESEYAVYGFIRVHVRYLVNYKYIHSIEKSAVILHNCKQLPLSRGKIQSVKNSFQFFSRMV
ncbi:MAG: LytTR family DNA-binding domain-containing protein [Oscillospiraceae bacterium]|nr:LytTR family DNA-binding domain-containing protein [Oscillospiraceae bacterium]